MITRLLKSKIFWLFVATVTCLVTLALTSKPREDVMFYEKVVNYVYIPVQKGISKISSGVKEVLLYFSDAKALSIENQNLKRRISELEEENRRLLGLEEENRRLNEILKLKSNFHNYETIVGRIIAKDPSNWFNIFVVDKGKKDGVNVNMAVVAPQGLVGQVTSVTYNSAKVMAIIDNNSSVSARLTKSRDLVVVRGDLSLKDQGLIKMNYIPVGVEVKEGDTVETSGIGGIFPKGIFIGRVIKVDNKQPQIMRYAIVQPAVDFKRLEEVVILKENFR